MKRFCPGAFQYAVIRIDPVAMVEHFNDPVATAEARALGTRKYLVYLDAIKLHGTASWESKVSICRFQPTPDPSNGITSDMAIPIYPNTRHPAGRASIESETPFPFSNCYFWLGTTVEVRIRRKVDMYDDSRAVKLSAMQHVRIELGFSNDFQQLHSFRQRQLSTAPPKVNLVQKGGNVIANLQPSRRVPVPLPQSTSSSQESRLSSPSGRAKARDNNITLVAGSEIDFQRCDSPAHDPPQYDPDVEAIFRMDIFGLAHDDAAEYLPLVDLWFELTEHLSADTIPNPLDFLAECDAIGRIIREARARSPHVPAPLRNEDGLSIMSEFSTEDSEFDAGSSSGAMACPAQHVVTQSPTNTSIPASETPDANAKPVC
ncbi:hypothetical protein BN946_scf184829.g67 [Trametes cinnabarina]|uniref:Uncharacterized protein n=1 Tax=Pycnoporus cinnabarinus TaxID=5643 RepID=A0A060SEX8_PYCCI|nr:hypothetical protein BN946_scf184829.g67 [Trametes cinnabarina]